MSNEIESKDISWDYFTADTLAERGACELIYAYAVVSAASTNSALYNGTSTSGKKIVDLKSAAVTGHEFSPRKPVYCHQGLYVDVGTNVSGIFVMWRKLPN